MYSQWGGAFSGNLTEKGQRVYSPNNKPNCSVSLSSRAIELTTSNLSSTGTWVQMDLQKSTLDAASEVITGVYAIGISTGQYSNSALYYMTNWKWQDNGYFSVYVARGSTDHNNSVKIVITVTKIQVTIS